MKLGLVMISTENDREKNSEPIFLSANTNKSIDSFKVFLINSLRKEPKIFEYVCMKNSLYTFVGLIYK